ncbi:MAG TPA: MFS transporter [Vicinamibacterales bacterium]|nr:MFS transporter [Vicinamibacterales bacterium]
MKKSSGVQVTATAFAALFSVVGLALYGLPLYYDFMVRELGWSRTMVTSGNAISKLVVGPVFGFAAGWIVDRFGPRRLMMAGIVMAGGALIGLGATSLAGAFYFFYFFNALGYVCGGPLPCQVLVSRWFDKTRGKVMGIAYLGIGIGGAIVPLLAAWLTARVGWRLSLQLLGVLIVLVALPLAYRVRENPRGRGGDDVDDGDDGADGDDVKPGRAQRFGEGAEPDPPVRLRAILATPAFYLLALASMCSIAAVGGTNQHLKLFLSLDRGYSQSDAAGIISLVLAISIAGRLLMGWLADRVPRKRVMLLIYLLVAAAIPLLVFVSGVSGGPGAPRAAAPGAATPYLFAGVFGLGLGGEYLIIPLMAGELFGVGVLGRVMGIVLTADGVAEATAPMLVGYLRDRTGTYNGGFLLLAAIALVGAGAVSLLPSAPRARAAQSVL